MFTIGDLYELNALFIILKMHVNPLLLPYFP